MSEFSDPFFVCVGDLDESRKVLCQCVECGYIRDVELTQRILDRGDSSPEVFEVIIGCVDALDDIVDGKAHDRVCGQLTVKWIRTR
jgi:hypothetical protein